MKPVRLHSLARAEIREAIAYYNDARDELGDDFRDVVETAIARIGRQPKASTPYGNGYRKCVFSRRFPYVIFYYEYEDHVWVATVYHTSREPDTWMDRVPEKNGDSNGQPTA
jgi:plasmid stabilization system protein ParE